MDQVDLAARQVIAQMPSASPGDRARVAAADGTLRAAVERVSSSWSYPRTEMFCRSVVERVRAITGYHGD